MIIVSYYEGAPTPEGYSMDVNGWNGSKIVLITPKGSQMILE